MDDFEVSYSQEELDQMRRNHIKRLQEQYSVSAETVQTYLDLKEEGYTSYEARVMSGMSDPNYWMSNKTSWLELKVIEFQNINQEQARKIDFDELDNRLSSLHPQLIDKLIETNTSYDLWSKFIKEAFILARVNH